MPQVFIRDVETHSDYRKVEELQKEVWEFDDRDIVPMTQMIAAKETGGVVLGAYDGSKMIGFVYGFVGHENGCLVIHSHMLAVKRTFRGGNVGFLLKLAQRDRALAQGIKVVTWTFDPLQSLNAHLNIEKLGVVAVEYKIDFYGETSSSLHRDIGTDRLWAKWELESDRVKQRIEGRTVSRPDVENSARLVRCGMDGRPLRCDPEIRNDRYLVVEIPGDIGALQENQPECAALWRKSTREALLQAFDAGFFVTGFRRLPGPSGPLGAYILTPFSSIGSEPSAPFKSSD